MTRLASETMESLELRLQRMRESVDDAQDMVTRGLNETVQVAPFSPD